MTAKVVYITGCLGFIGGHVTRRCLERGWYVTGVDCETYAANADLLDEFRQYKNFRYQKKNINDISMLQDCDYVINLAAETHVDNSIASSAEFIKSNINGIHNLLGLMQSKSRFKLPTLVHFSTDEVYGDLVSGSHAETDIMQPSNPYSATKASADMLVLAWHRTHGVPYLILRPSNNYGVGQHSEKFIPKICRCLLLDRKVPMHERGQPIRTWLHVEDTADAVLFLLDKQATNGIYNVSGDYQDSNINIFQKVLAAHGIDPIDVEKHADFSFIRPGQDVRYSIDDSKLRQLGWKNLRSFDSEIGSIVNYYRSRFTW
jgi:dTDP-glucose 4,6-dehydratase